MNRDEYLKTTIKQTPLAPLAMTTASETGDAMRV